MTYHKLTGGGGTIWWGGGAYNLQFMVLSTTILDKIVGTLYIYLAKYDPHFQQGLTVPPSPHSMLH